MHVTLCTQVLFSIFEHDVVGVDVHNNNNNNYYAFQLMMS